MKNRSRQDPVRFLCKCVVLAAALAAQSAWSEPNAQGATARGATVETAGKRLLPLEHTLNTRDLGGYATADGRRVKWGSLYRSDSLSKLSQRDQLYLAGLGLSVVTDFRSEQERAEAPDRLPRQTPPISYRIVAVNNPAVDVAELGRKVFSGELPETEMLSLLDRTSYVTDQRLRDAWGNWLRSLSEPGALPQMFHCTAGKDRTGFAAAIVLLTLGVPRESVMQDFVLSNTYLAEKIDLGVSQIQSGPGAGIDPEVLAQVIGVSPRSLEDAFLEMEARYGSVDKYISDGLGIDGAMRLKLQGLLLD